MNRTPKPDPSATRAPTYPAPAPADYSDEVSNEQIDALKKVVGPTDPAEWTVVGGPAW